MPYLVLARKYRPQNFTDLVGQEHVIRTLTNAIKLNRIAHGYLFTGTRGVGKTTVARILAKALNCEAAEGPTPEPCGECVSCREIANSTSGDVFEIDAASNTGVDDIRELRENVKYLPSRGRYKVYIIDEVHMLSKSAFNALLKTLEEPPPHVVFIFATTEPHKIPDTVLSRTQHFEFKMISLAAIRDYLAKLMKAEKTDVPSDVLNLVARKAAGSVRDSLSHMDQVLSYGPDRPLTEIAEVLGVVDRQTLLDMSDAILRNDPVGVLDILAKLGTSNWDVKDLLTDLLEHFRNLVAAKLAKQPALLIDAGEAELAALAEQVKDAPAETLEHLFLLLADGEELILRSGQPRLALEMTLVRMADAAKIQPLDDLLAELTKLKEAGGGPVATTAQPIKKKAENDLNQLDSTPPDPASDPHGALVHALKPKKRSLATFLAQGGVQRSGKRLKLQIAAGFSYKQFERELSLVTQIARELFQDEMEIELEAVAVKKKETGPSEADARQAARQKQISLRKETMNHPAVQWTNELFPDANIDIKPLKPTEE